MIQFEGKNAEVVRRYRVVSRLFRTVFFSGSTEVALEVESPNDPAYGGAIHSASPAIWRDSQRVCFMVLAAWASGLR